MSERRHIPMSLRCDVEMFIASGVLHRNGVGWIRVVKAPASRDLPFFVATIAKLGSWSVDTGSGAPVEMSTGNVAGDVLFRLPTEPPAATVERAPKMLCAKHGAVAAEWVLFDAGPVAYCPRCHDTLTEQAS